MRPQDDELPPEIQAALQALYQPARGMEGRDAELLRAARAAGAARPWTWRRWAAVGIAAAIAVTVGITWVIPRNGTYARTGDIRDAYYLARQLKDGKGSTLEATWDVNKDGVIDERDVRALAQAAVSLSGGKALAVAAVGGSGKGGSP